MKKIFPLIFVPLLSLFSVSAQITQAEADSIVKERFSNNTSDFTIFAKEDVQTEFEITTATGEMLELNYPCLIYYVNFINETNGKYLIIKASNGNVLEINTKNDVPDDLEEWRLVSPALYGTTWKLVGIVDLQAGTLTKLEPEDCDFCYKLWFDTWLFSPWVFHITAVRGYYFSFCYIVNYISFTLDFPVYPCFLSGPAVEDTPDGETFRRFFRFEFLPLGQFGLKETELKLYSSDKMRYLLFNKINYEK